jgi:AcrR family transcriptional regulator
MTKRLSWDERHRQLIQVALGHVRREGADRLTLIKVAEEAGVTKPLVYKHFRSREGLLIELCLEIDEIQRTQLKRLHEDPKADLRKLAASVSRSYVECYAKSNGEWLAVYAVMKSSPELAAIQQDLFDKHVDVLIALFGPKTRLDAQRLRLICVGLIGAAETISAQLNRDGITVTTAVETLTTLFVSSLSNSRADRR